MRFSSKDDFSITVLIPCYNEEENLGIFYNELLKVVCDYNYSLIFIDDGSSDNTLAFLKILSATNPNINFISLSRNFGHQLALKAGYDAPSSGDCVICMDADLQHPPIVIHSMIEKWLQGFQIINGIRDADGKLPLMKKTSSYIFYKIINFFSKYKIVEHGPDFRLVDKKIADIIKNLTGHNLFLREVMSWAGFSQTSVTFKMNQRKYGSSKYSLKKMISLSINAFFSYGLNPLRLAIFIGLFLSAISFLYGFYAIYSYLFNSNTVPGWTSMMASFLFIAGFQFILIGIIGEYLGRTYIETRKRPSYLINESTIEIAQK